MKSSILILTLIIGVSNCKSQSNQSINKLFINQFITDNKKDLIVFAKDTLYIYGEGLNYKENDIYVNFLEFKEIKDKVAKNGKFNLIEMSEIFVNNNLFKIEFNFLIALKDEEVDFATSHNTSLIYCMKFNCKKNIFEVYECENK